MKQAKPQFEPTTAAVRMKAIAYAMTQLPAIPGATSKNIRFVFVESEDSDVHEAIINRASTDIIWHLSEEPGYDLAEEEGVSTDECRLGGFYIAHNDQVGAEVYPTGVDDLDSVCAIKHSLSGRYTTDIPVTVNGHQFTTDQLGKNLVPVSE